MNAALVAAPAAAEGSVLLKTLPRAAAALLVEPDVRSALLWVANLDRHAQQFLLDIPPGAHIRLFRRSVEMPPVPEGEVALAYLSGAENGVWIVESPTRLDPEAILAALRVGKGR